MASLSPVPSRQQSLTIQNFGTQGAAKAKGKKKASAMLSDDEDTADDDSASEGEWAPKVGYFKML